MRPAQRTVPAGCVCGEDELGAALVEVLGAALVEVLGAALVEVLGVGSLGMECIL